MPNQSETNTVPNNSKVFHRYIFTPEGESISGIDSALLEMPGIYCILNTETKSLYIGSSLNVYKRTKAHVGALESGGHICKSMNAQYIKNRDVFVVFAIEYFSLSEYTLVESKRTALLNIEMQYMKRVPRARLYNTVTPASLSERLLNYENIKGTVTIGITDICTRIGMSVDSIRANGLNSWDKLTVQEAEDFVQKRTVANGRWTEDKADKARIYLLELQSLNNGAYDEAQIKKALMEYGELDYFDHLTPSPPWKRAGWRGTVEVILMIALLIIATVTSIHNIYSVCSEIADPFSALLMTVMLSGGGITFVSAGIKGGATWFLVISIVGFEALCNMVCVFGGLTHWHLGLPTEFLSIVCDYANTGTYITARVISVVAAFLIAGVQYAALYQIRKRT